MILIWNYDDTAQLHEGIAAFNWSGVAGAAGPVVLLPDVVVATARMVASTRTARMVASTRTARMVASTRTARKL